MIRCLFVLGLLVAAGGKAFAVEQSLESVAKGCDKELTAFCKDVTPGEGRMLACLYSREDKLSAKCEYALYDAAAQLQRVIATLAFVANECDADLEKFCSNVPMGGGRLLACIDKNEKAVSKRCKDALSEAGLKKEKGSQSSPEGARSWLRR
jgi:hypothetical protein